MQQTDTGPGLLRSFESAFDEPMKAGGALMEMHQNAGFLMLKESLQPSWNKSMKGWRFFC